MVAKTDDVDVPQTISGECAVLPAALNKLSNTSICIPGTPLVLPKNMWPNYYGRQLNSSSLPTPRHKLQRMTLIVAV